MIEGEPSNPSWPVIGLDATLSLVPAVGGALAIVAHGLRARYQHKMWAAAERIAEEVGGDLLTRRLEESPELDALFLQAITAAAQSGLAAKRHVLSSVVAHAVKDDAKLDTAQLLVAAMAELEAPHIRDLARLEGWASSLEEDKGEVFKAHPAVAATLVRLGLAYQATTTGSLYGMSGLTGFGEAILSWLRQVEGSDA